MVSNNNKYSKIQEDETTGLNNNNNNASVSISTETNNTTINNTDKNKEEVKKEEKKGKVIKIGKFSITISTEQFYLLFYLVMLVLSGTANRVAFNYMGIAMGQDFSYFLSNLTTFIYIPLFFGISFVRRCAKKIPDEMWKFPIWKTIIMGFFDATASILLLFGNVQVTGNMQVLLNQGAIPLTMMASFIFLKARYKIQQYLGAFIIMIGIAISLISSFIHPSGGGSNSILWCALYFSNNIPSALSGVYKELAFKSQPLDIYWLNAWISLFQFIWGLLYFPVNLIPLFGGVPIKQIPILMWNGILCMVTITPAGLTDLPSNYCRTHFLGLPVFIPVFTYLFFNILYNIFILLVLKYGTAALMYIGMTVTLPLSSLAFFVCGVFITKVFHDASYSSPFQWENIVGLVVILFGIILYRAVRRKPEEKDKSTDVVPIFGINQPEFTSAPVRQSRYVGESLIQPKNIQDIRSNFYRKVGVVPSPVSKHELQLAQLRQLQEEAERQDQEDLEQQQTNNTNNNANNIYPNTYQSNDNNNNNNYI